MFKKTAVSLFLFLTCVVIAQENRYSIEIDSIIELRNQSRTPTLDSVQQIAYAKKALVHSKDIKVDSTILKSYLNLSLAYLNAELYKPFKSINHKSLTLAKELNDSLYIAYSQHNLAWYYEVELQYDSAYYYYYNARKLYSSLKDARNEGEVLLNMAYIQQSERDYIGAETNAIKAIELLKTLPEDDHNLDTLWSLHNMVGAISHQLKLYDKAIEYHEKALAYGNEISQNYFYKLYSRNNIALVYKDKGDFESAKSIYKSLLETKDLFETDASFYTILLGNYTNIKFLSNSTYNYNEIENEFNKAYTIADSLNEASTITTIGIDFANFYYKNDENKKAKTYLNRSLKLSKEINENQSTLKALKLLSKVEKGVNATNYLNEYIALSDSLLLKERSIRNKFARIEFETDEIKAENVQISKERLIFLMSSIGLAILLFLIYTIITQKAKNKELQFAQEQQQTNEEIYNLMLAQQDKIDEGRAEEKKRISQELHDGILGRLFGTRLSLDSLNLSQTEDAIKSRSQYINELKTIESEIRKISHDLNTDFISESGFIDIITTLIDNQTKAYKLKCEFKNDSDIDWDSISNKNKIHIYRMLQESLQNIYKHAKASLIKIGFEQKNNVILVSITDNGQGFNTAKARKGIGLKNIDARVREVGGKAEIFSKINQGTIIKISIPI